MQRTKLYIPSLNALPLVSQPSCLLGESLYASGHKHELPESASDKNQLSEGLKVTQ